MKDGIVNVMKPPGITSHDAVNCLRRVYHTKKVGHTGTLDPEALGVLPICIGQATRLAEYLTDKEKEYRVMMKFGISTDTEDNTGEIIARAPLPTLTREEFVEVCQSFVGEIERMPRKIMIYAIEVLMYSDMAALLNVRCGKGTYIRTLCTDIAKKCGSLGHMCYLMRNQSGAFRVEDAVRLDALEASTNPEEYLLPMEVALADMPVATVSDETKKRRLQNGLAQKIDFGQSLIEGTLAAAVDENGHLLAVGHWREEQFQPHKVFKVGENDAAL